MKSSKTCFKCQIEKPMDDFYRHPAMGDGHLGKCKQCTKQDVLEHRLKNIDKIREYDKKRSKLPPRAKKQAKRLRLWRDQDKRRAKCHNAIARAITRGDLACEPCSVCGREDSQAHHDDYDKPLDVIWLCPPCHSKRHKMLKIKTPESF